MSVSISNAITGRLGEKLTYGGNATVDSDSAGRTPGLGADHPGVAINEDSGGIAPVTSFQVSSVSPAVGYTAGGTAITITGTGFTATPTVVMGGTTCTSIVFVNSTTITAVTPAKATGSYSLVVTNPDSSSGSLTYFYGVSVTGISPSSGSTSGGQSVTITGNGFLSGATVSIGGSSATSVTVGSATSITCLTPAHSAATSNVVVTNTNTDSGTLTSGFIFGANPVTVTSLSVTSGVDTGSTATVITGTGFAAGATVTFGGNSATSVVVNSSTSISCVTPAHAAGAVTVVVTNTDTGSGSLASGFTYSPSPSLDSINIAVGRLEGGTAVTLSGQNFVATPTVTFGGVSATSIVRVSASTVTCVTPAGSAGAVNIVLTNPDGGTSTLSSGFTYTAVAATSLSQTSGSTSGGTATTLTGAGFYTGISITLGGVACTSVTVISSTSVSFVTPANTSGAKALVVTNVDGGTATLNSAFTYSSGAVTVDSVSPSVGPIGGATAITITGSNFTGTPTVTIGGTACTSIVRVNGTTITAVTPAKAVGAYDLVVDTGTLVSGFTYTLKDGLVAYWNLNERSGARADSHTGGFTLADNNSTRYAGGIRSGATGGASVFAGNTTERVTVTHSSAVTTAGGDFSWAGWVNFTSVAARVILSKSGGSSNYEYKIATTTTRFTFSTSNNAGSVSTVTANNFGAYTSQTWYFVACTYTASSKLMTISINGGTQDTATATSSATGNTSDLLIPGELTTSPSTYGNVLAGALSAWGFWKGRVLSTSDITSIYNNGLGKFYADLTAGEKTSLSAFWNYTEGAVAISGTIADSVGSSTGTSLAATTNRSGIVSTTAAANIVINQLTYLSTQLTTLDNTTSTDFSISFWMNTADVSGARYVIFKGGRTATEAGFCIQRNGAACRMLFSNATTQKIMTAATSSTAVNTWVHHVFTVSRTGNITCYVNGSSSGTPLSISTTTGSIGSFEFDIGAAIGTTPLGGTLEYVGVWSKVLTAGEATSLYNSGVGRTYSQL